MADTPLGIFAVRPLSQTPSSAQPAIGRSAVAVACLLMIINPVWADADPLHDEVSRHAVTARAQDAGSDIVWRSHRACGVNCLYLLLRSYDVPVEYVKLQDQMLRETLPSLTDLKQAAARYGLSAVMGKADREGLAALPKPLIAHQEYVGVRGDTGGHFVLVTAVKRDSVTLVDGSTAEPRTMDWSEFHRDWSGHVLFVPSDQPSGLGWYVGVVLAGVAVAFLLDKAMRLIKPPIRKGSNDAS